MAGADSTLVAYRAARERTACAREVEGDLLGAAMFDAQERGLSIRETAALLGVAKSTVARHRAGGRYRWMLGKHAVWVSERGYMDAHNAAWAHEPGEQIERAPFQITDLPDGSREWSLFPSRTLPPPSTGPGADPRP